jgi:hypothetical protein
MGSVVLGATRVVVSGVAAGAEPTCESASNALEIAIAIVRFFSIRKSPIPQTDYRMLRLIVRSPGAAIAKQTPPSAPGKWAVFSRSRGCEVNPHYRAPNATDRAPGATADSGRGGLEVQGAVSGVAVPPGILKISDSRVLVTARASRGSYWLSDKSAWDTF